MTNSEQYKEAKKDEQQKRNTWQPARAIVPGVQAPPVGTSSDNPLPIE